MGSKRAAKWSPCDGCGQSKPGTYAYKVDGRIAVYCPDCARRRHLPVLRYQQTVR